MSLAFFDTETHKILPGLLAPPLVCVTAAVDDQPSVLLDAKAGTEWFRARLEAKDHIVAQNLSFDAAVLCAHDASLIPLVFDAYRAGRFHDTKIRQELIDIAAGRIQRNGNTLVWRDGEWRKADYSLAGLVRHYTGKDRSAQKTGPDVWRLRFGELDGVPLGRWPREAVDYALEDTDDARTVFHAQAAAAVAAGLSTDGSIPTEAEQCRAAWMLHLMSCWGIRTDADAVTALEAALNKDRSRLFQQLHRAGLFKTRRARPDEVAEGKVDFWEESKRGPRPVRYQRDVKLLKSIVERVYTRSGREVPTTDTGAVSTEKDALQESGSRLLKAVSEIGGLDKLLDTYVPVLKTGTAVPINARFNVLVNSGRTSCSRPNLQNLPSGRRVGGVRETFVPRPGFLFCSVDYGTLELRALAQRCLTLFGFSRMAEVLREGKDLHCEMAAQILGVPYEQVEANRKVKGSPEKAARDLAKVANFGMGGAMGAESFVQFARKSYGIRLERFLADRSPDETDHAAAVRKAWQLKNAYLQSWPEMRRMFQYISERVGESEATFVDPDTHYVRGGVGYCESANHQFQHPAAMGAKAAGFALAEECYVDTTSPLYGSRPIAFIHDEYIVEVPDDPDQAHAASFRIVDVMVKEMSRIVRDVPVTAEPTLMRFWSKDAEAVYDPSGRLVPWLPPCPEGTCKADGLKTTCADSCPEQTWPTLRFAAA